jgi:dTDP-4-amino-4,6-dideoxygalactose transaminase
MRLNTRRYFYPALNALDYTNQEACPMAEDIALRVLCLPMSTHIGGKEIKMISDLIIKEIG